MQMEKLSGDPAILFDWWSYLLLQIAQSLHVVQDILPLTFLWKYEQIYEIQMRATGLIVQRKGSRAFSPQEVHIYSSKLPKKCMLNVLFSAQFKTNSYTASQKFFNTL